MNGGTVYRQNLLTPQETNVARLVAQGLSNGAIAEYLSASQGTVETHIKHIYSKLEPPRGVDVRVWLALYMDRKV